MLRSGEEGSSSRDAKKSVLYRESPKKQVKRNFRCIIQKTDQCQGPKKKNRNQPGNLSRGWESDWPVPLDKPGSGLRGRTRRSVAEDVKVTRHRNSRGVKRSVGRGEVKKRVITVHSDEERGGHGERRSKQNVRFSAFPRSRPVERGWVVRRGCETSRKNKNTGRSLKYITVTLQSPGLPCLKKLRYNWPLQVCPAD